MNLSFRLKAFFLFHPMGSSGLEPPTSRLSGARSNLLSYEPSSRQTPYPPLPPAEKAPSLRCLSSFQPDPLCWALSGGKSGAFSISFILNGGDKRDRTVDLLLARQALSQLSYTPIYLCRTFLHFFCVPSKLNNVLSTQNSSPDV